MEDWAPFNVSVTDTRPASGDYTMNMTGPTNPFGGGVLGIAPLDCNDSQTHNNITYAFHSANDQFSSSTQATTIGQEVAHSYGLEHVDEPGDIMNPYNAGGDPSFRDECITIVANGGIVCGSQHAANCGSQGSQNSYAELMALFGPGTPDTMPPTVQITNPTDGATFPAGADFAINVDATDDNGVKELRLYVNGTYEAKDVDSPYGWPISGIPEGSYEFYVIGVDLAGNEAMSNVVSIGVGGAPTTGGGTATTGGSGTGGDDTGVPPPITGGETDGLPPGFGQGDEDKGCGCSTESTPPPAVLGVVVAALLAHRRRRRA
jgi:MYXO-CTERM domain-containing protein